jgi:RNA polymerase sigma-70 factor (ECF subfamily)
MATDEQLMLDVRRGSRAAFEQIFERYREPVWRFFRRRVPDAGRAEELAQDAFVALLEGASRYKPRGAFRSYLFGIAYNILHADWRKTSRRELVPLEADRMSIDGQGEAGIWVRQALAELDDDDREILMLREYEQLTYREIADLRTLPLNTVRSRLFRARMALKALLDRRAPVPFERTRATQGES